MRVIPILDATARGVTVGRHSIWTGREKIPFQFCGRVQKYQHAAEATYAPADVIPHEVAILRALAAEGMAPPIGDLVYVETLISEHPGGWWADPVGAWGYEMADARALPPGRFSVEAMRRLPIAGSEGAWNDITVPGRDNVVNGYLVDVARSRFDMLRWAGPLAPLPDAPAVDVGALAADAHRRCAFPPGERPEAYQDFHLGGTWHRGARRVVERAALLGFRPKAGETLLEIGCQSGGFLQLAALAGARAIGVEVVPEYVEIGRKLAGASGLNVSVRLMDAVRERDALLSWIGSLGRVDHLLCLSMEKHLGEGPMFALVDAIGARTTYIETNAVSDKNPWKLRAPVEARGGRHVGDSADRNLRRLYRIERRS